MRISNQYLPTGLLLISLFSCKKESSPEPSNGQLFIGNKWLLTSSIISAPNAPEVDAFSSLQGCVKDNLIEFAQNNDYIYDEGAIKCQPSDAQTQYGSWLLSSDAKQLTITFNGSKRTYSVEELSSQNLKIKFTFASSSGATVTQTNTYRVK